MESTHEELVKYAIEMRRRGDSYVAVRNYLVKNCSDEETIGRVITEVDNYEKNHMAKEVDKKPFAFLNINILLGAIFLVAGIILMFFLWDKGLISTVPFILIGIGVLALTGAIKY
jgi:hypothetical protein